MRSELSAKEARRVALAAQSLSTPRRAGPATADAFLRLARRLGAIQIDSVNVLARTHYLPAFSRLGPYPRAALERAAWGPRPRLFEYWGHMASLMPIEIQPLFRWRMERALRGDTWSGLARFARERRDYVAAALARVRAEGPLTGGDFADEARRSGWWEWTSGKRALEWLFWSGQLMVRTRRGFERVYDLTERVLPPAIAQAPTPDEAQAQRALVAIAAKAMGVATEGDLRDYFRLPVAGARARVAELVEAGALKPVRVEGWRQPAFLDPLARLPRRGRAAALLSPFDNLIWRRERTERLFGARVRLEIYTPGHKREHGYYVLPFLLGERIVGRVDLKSDRKAGALLVQAAHLEAGASEGAVAHALAAELLQLAAWLGLGSIVVKPRGDLATALAPLVGQANPD
ncbi:MAG TPA: crosslink repair DNA glycosylase YcaQ family protein [Caulobacteraceae bacterium]|nr:crosslink repair DNA glycosylase YcaQ family protein [Caulobacteraceae bacterium]